MSKTNRDKCLVDPKDHQYKMAYGESNGHMIDDVMWPWKPERSKSWPRYVWRPVFRKRLDI